MELLEQIAEAAIARDSLRLRSLVQNLLHSPIPLSHLARPASHDPKVLAVSASVVELLAARQAQMPPAWTREIGALAEPFFLVQAAMHMKRLRTLCETQSPEPMRKRRLYAPPHFLQFA